MTGGPRERCQRRTKKKHIINQISRAPPPKKTKGHGNWIKRASANLRHLEISDQARNHTTLGCGLSPANANQRRHSEICNSILRPAPQRKKPLLHLTAHRYTPMRAPGPETPPREAENLAFTWQNLTGHGIFVFTPHHRFQSQRELPFNTIPQPGVYNRAH